MAQQFFLRELMYNLTRRGDLTFMHDPVSAANLNFGYKHPLVDYQPIVNKLLGNRPLTRIPASQATELPKVDFFVTGIGTLIEPFLPNHGNCCYFQGNDCVVNYEKGHSRYLKQCKTVLYR